MAATLDGSSVFGSAVVVNYDPQPTAAQENTFFGLSGAQVLDGGKRPRMIQVRGVLSGANYAAVVAAETALNAYVDGAVHTLVDNFGRSLSSVRLVGKLRPDPTGIKRSNLGYSMAYTLMLQDLEG